MEHLCGLLAALSAGGLLLCSCDNNTWAGGGGSGCTICTRSRTVAHIQKIEGFMQIFQSRHQGKLPTSVAGIKALLNEKIIEDEDDTKDEWGNDLIYVYPARRPARTKYDLFSKGPDEIDGSEDDIANWTK